jgi:hypothetical protein
MAVGVIMGVLVSGFVFVVVTVLRRLTFFRCLTGWRGRFRVVRLVL